MGPARASGGPAISTDRDRPTGKAGDDTRLRAVRQVETITIEDIFQEYLGAVYRFVYRHVGNHHDAEDLASEVFLKATTKLDPQRPREAIGSWLFTVTRSVLADHWRRHYRLPPLIDISDVDVAGFPGNDSGPRPLATSTILVDRILAALPARQAQVLRLRFLQGYTLAETAAELDITVTNTKVIQHRALAAAVELAEELK